MPLSGSHSRSLRLIAALKLFKGSWLLAVGIGALKLLHKDVAAETARWVDLFRVDPDNRYIHRLLENVAIVGIDPEKIYILQQPVNERESLTRSSHSVCRW